jgi:HemY protein
VWHQFDASERRDPFVAARAATLAAGFGAGEEARGWLRPVWEQLDEFAAEERSALAEALAQSASGIGTDWLPRLEAAERAHPRDGMVALAVGAAYAERQIWGKARTLLEQAAADDELTSASRRRAWRLLAKMAQEQGDAVQAARCFEAAAGLG